MSASARNGQDVPNLLRAAYAQHVTKRTAMAADVPVETARNWVRGRATPSASTLLNMAARCDRIASALERLLHDRRANRAADPVLPMAGDSTAADRGAAS